MDIIDLREQEFYIEQYVNLRNKYTDLLLTYPINIQSTKESLVKNDVEIRVLAQNNILVGAVILYLYREGEIAFFVKEKNKGIGSRLLGIVEEVANKRGLKFIWAWVLKDNYIAQRVFEKNGFIKKNISKREHKGLIKYGINYKKNLIKV